MTGLSTPDHGQTDSRNGGIFDHGNNFVAGEEVGTPLALLLVLLLSLTCPLAVVFFAIDRSVPHQESRIFE
jgi:hypothetical protein